MTTKTILLFRRCKGGSLDKTEVKGKSLLCDGPHKAIKAFHDGSKGAILIERLK